MTTDQGDEQRRHWRAALSAQRKALGAAERLAAAQGLRHSLEQLPEFLVDENVAGYWACGGELPLNVAIAPLAARGQRFLLPLIGPGRMLRFVPWQAGDEVQPNRHGIPEPVDGAGSALAPQQLDLVLLPLLGFDRRGHRLGFGGGYYDTSFAFLGAAPRPGSPLLVGIGYAFQELPAIAPQPWDIALDYIATERELIDCAC
jgi:5-formyltetrahydrofolate cyclo-ligase